MVKITQYIKIQLHSLFIDSWIRKLMHCMVVYMAWSGDQPANLLRFYLDLMAIIIFFCSFSRFFFTYNFLVANSWLLWSFLYSTARRVHSVERKTHEIINQSTHDRDKWWMFYIVVLASASACLNTCRRMLWNACSAAVHWAKILILLMSYMNSSDIANIWYYIFVVLNIWQDKMPPPEGGESKWKREREKER